MDSFLDSNVVLNYIFDLDRGHSESEDIIFKSTSYYSSNVKNEVENLFIRKNKEYKSFILRVDAFINKFSDYDVVNDNYVHGFINNMRPIGKFKVNDMHYAFDKIWEKFGFDESHDAFEVKSKLNIFKKEFQLLHQSRKDSIFAVMNLVPNYTKKDKKILDIIKKQNLRDGLLHDMDENILFDADEFAKNNKDLDLEFVTADQSFFKAITILMDYLSINSCINLMEYSTNA